MANKTKQKKQFSGSVCKALCQQADDFEVGPRPKLLKVKDLLIIGVKLVGLAYRQ